VLALSVLALLAPTAVAGDAAPPPSTAEVLRERQVARETEATLPDALEKMCQEDGKSWDDAKRECVWLMRAKD
jgi:hypothetical protein